MAFIACKEAGAIAIQLCTTCDLEKHSSPSKELLTLASYLAPQLARPNGGQRCELLLLSATYNSLQSCLHGGAEEVRDSTRRPSSLSWPSSPHRRPRSNDSSGSRSKLNRSSFHGLTCSAILVRWKVQVNWIDLGKAESCESNLTWLCDTATFLSTACLHGLHARSRGP